MAEIWIDGRRLDDEFVGQVVIAAATALSENDTVEGSTTSDASLNALGSNIANLTRAILNNLGISGNS